MKQNKLWIFDFDGTLSAIVPNHHAAMLDPDCREMLLMLVEKFGGSVAVISSRPLYDLSSRVTIPGIYLGGNCGLVWQLPGGEKKSFNTNFSGHLEEKRAAALPKIKALELLKGVEIEDKVWSLTLHVRHLSQEAKEKIFNSIIAWQSAYAFQVYHEPEALEIHFLPEVNKLTGMQHLCSLLDQDPALADITYAGDDENNIPAMLWVLHHKGVVYTVGDVPLVPGAKLVASPAALAHEILQLFNLRPGELRKGTWFKQ